MVVGGEHVYYDVEIIDLSDEMRVCNKPADAPLFKTNIGAFTSGAPVICGSTCFRYDHNVS